VLYDYDGDGITDAIIQEAEMPVRVISAIPASTRIGERLPTGEGAASVRLELETLQTYRTIPTVGPPPSILIVSDVQNPTKSFTISLDTLSLEPLTDAEGVKSISRNKGDEIVVTPVSGAFVPVNETDIYDTRIIGTNDPQFNQGVGGWYNPASGVMFVNVITANKQLIRERYSKNASSSPEGIGTFWHELAHARHYTNKFTEIDAPRQPLLEYMLEFGLTESRLTLDEKDFAREHLSEYASTSHMEFIAEAVKAAKTDALDLTDEQMRFVLDVFERLDGPTELLR